MSSAPLVSDAPDELPLCVICEESEARATHAEHGPLCAGCAAIMVDVDDVLAALELRDLLNGGAA